MGWIKPEIKMSNHDFMLGRIQLSVLKPKNEYYSFWWDIIFTFMLTQINVIKFPFDFN